MRKLIFKETKFGDKIRKEIFYTDGPQIMTTQETSHFFGFETWKLSHQF